MLSAIRMYTATNGRGLCDIDSVFFRLDKSSVEKLGSLSTTKIYRYKYTDQDTKVIGIFSSWQDFPFF